MISEYLEEIYPTRPACWARRRARALPSTPCSRLADIYLLNNMFMLSGQTRALHPQRGGARRYVGRAGDPQRRGAGEDDRRVEGGYALMGRVTLADCTLVPALFMIENVLPATDTPDPLPANPKVASYWARDQQHQDPSAAKVMMVELHRGLAGAPRADPAHGGEGAGRGRDPIGHGRGCFGNASSRAGREVVAAALYNSHSIGRRLSGRDQVFVWASRGAADQARSRSRCRKPHAGPPLAP